MLNTTPRLPGVLCETRLPNLGQQPLRLDVTGFVGLAERGPLDVPVLIEDFSQYRLIFGGDLPVARTEGWPLYAHLPRTVEAFFENGGRRCYVVRVAGRGSRPNKFQIPGLLYETNGGWQPVVVHAAWPGRWSDLVTLATSLQIRPLQIRTDSGDLALSGEEINKGDFQLPMRLPVPDTARGGDLLRLYINQGDEKYHLYLRVGEVIEEPDQAATELFGLPVMVSPKAGGGTTFRSNPTGIVPDSVAQLSESGWTDLPFAAVDYGWTDATDDDPTYRLIMPVDRTVKIEAGDLLRVAGPAGIPTVFFTAEQVQREVVPPINDVRLIIESETPLRLVDNLDPLLSYTIAQVEVLSFNLRVREGETMLENFLDLRYGEGDGYWTSILQPDIRPEQIYPLAFTVDDFSRRSLRLGIFEGEDPLPLPIGMGAAHVYSGPKADPLPAGKDGLDTYDPVGLFMDKDFTAVGVRTLMATANELLHLAAEPRRLRGMHSLIPVQEVALITIPDLAHIGWEMLYAPLMITFEKEDDEEPLRGFHDCPPEEMEVVDDKAAPVIILDPDTAEPEPNSQAWLENLPEQLEPPDHDNENFLSVQRALIRLCAARADVVAVLSLPQHFNRQAAGKWHQALTTTPDFYDGNPLSYAAVYHGWLAIREESTPSLAPLRYLPPDGFATGMIAARELRRGAWIAPANVPLLNTADLKPNFKDEEWYTLFEKQMNIVRRQPGRYALMSAMTLSRDIHYRQLSVRRLLILLRKLALREGQRYVFEVNNERFQALVQTYFENILNRILERGGLQAFQVVTDEEVNTQNDYDNGRFIIALKVAPTLPIEFITITMLRSNEDALTILEQTA